MRRHVTLATACATAMLSGCGGEERNASPEPLPRVEIRASQGTDIGALPTVAPPPGLKLSKKETGGGDGGVVTPTPTPPTPPTRTPTPRTEDPPTPVPPTPTPGITFEPPDG